METKDRPGAFEGNGEDALKWIADIKEELDVQFTVEVANTSHRISIKVRN